MKVSRPPASRPPVVDNTLNAPDSTAAGFFLNRSSARSMAVSTPAVFRRNGGFDNMFVTRVIPWLTWAVSSSKLDTTCRTAKPITPVMSSTPKRKARPDAQFWDSPHLMSRARMGSSSAVRKMARTIGTTTKLRYAAA